MIFNEIVSNPYIMNEIKKNIYIKPNSVLNDLQENTRLNEGGIQLFSDDLYNRIINVGEFPIEK